MMSAVVYVGLIFALAASSQGAPAGSTAVQVDVDKFGRVNGFQVKTLRKKIDVFLGIPFAQPPIGNLRFRPPEPLNDTFDEYDATELPPTCSQSLTAEVDAGPNNASEDCLYLNIWKPHGCRNKAVMVWIHGGGFVVGSSTESVYDGRVLAAKGDVIVASMQYRLGPLGFLSFCNESAPGNVGLLDQQLAMDWIHKHIADFGGDPTRVTLFGNSAGAASVGYHLLSPGSDNLFRSAILQSGTPIAHWAFIEPEEAKERAYKLAELVGCSRDSAVECMREKPPELLAAKQWLVRQFPSFALTFVPTIDDKFLTKSPAELMQYPGEFQRKDILQGVNSHEGSRFIILSFADTFDLTKEYNDNITSEEYREMVEKLRLVNSSSDVVIDTIASIYSLPCGSQGNIGDDDGETYFMALDGMFGDIWLKCPLLDTARPYARENKVYMYAYNHRSSASQFPEWAGDAIHGHEIHYMFGVPFRDNTYNDKERTLSGRMITFWTNFAKTGDPNKDDTGDQTDQTWPEYTNDGRQVLVLDTGRKLQTQTGLRDRYCQFWSELVPRLVAATEGHSWLKLETIWTQYSFPHGPGGFCSARLFVAIYYYERFL